MKNFEALLLIGFLFATACSKSENTDNPNGNNSKSPLQITILKPEASKTYQRNDTIFIEVFLWDELSLHDYVLSVKNNYGFEYYSKAGHTHFPEFTVSDFWINTAKAGEDLYLEVIANNHNNFIQKEKIKILNP